MEKAVSAADANRKFFQLLQGVRRGCSYVVKSHGKPVARIIPVDENQKIEVKRARESASQTASPVRDASRRWTRDELYEDKQ